MHESFTLYIYYNITKNLPKDFYSLHRFFISKPFALCYTIFYLIMPYATEPPVFRGPAGAIFHERKGPVMANRVVFHIAGQTYNMLSDESVDYMNEVAELAQQTVAQCGGSSEFASTRALALAAVTLADDYIKAKTAAEAAEAKCRALEAELSALRDQQAHNNGKHPNNHNK